MAQQVAACHMQDTRTFTFAPKQYLILHVIYLLSICRMLQMSDFIITAAAINILFISIATGPNSKPGPLSESSWPSSISIWSICACGFGMVGFRCAISTESKNSWLCLSDSITFNYEFLIFMKMWKWLRSCPSLILQIVSHATFSKCQLELCQLSFQWFPTVLV